MAKPAHHAGYAAQGQSSETGAPAGSTSNHRAEAIHACNAEASKYSEMSWGHQQSNVYRACMTQHGETE